MLEAEVLKTEEKNSSFYIYLKNVTCKSEAKTFKYHVIILTAKKEAKLKEGALDENRAEDAIKDLWPGNRILAEASCAGFLKARNKGNYDEEAYYHSLGIEEKFQLSGSLTRTSQKIRPLRCLLLLLKEKLQESIFSLTSKNEKPSIAENHAGIFMAILTGDRSSLDTDTKDLYRKSGIAHILAISGLHISFIGMSLFSFLRKRMRFLFAALLSGSIMIFFCIMSGESASAVRATVMFLVRLLALKFGKRFDLLSALGLSGIFLLLSNPLYLFNSGFQLSFGAILGIGLLAPAISKLCLEAKQFFIGRRKGNAQFVIEADQRSSMIKESAEKLAAALISSLSITLITFPAIINSYYEIPVLSVLLNLFVIPLMGYVLGSGVFGTLLGLISMFLGRMLIGAGVYLISFIEFLCALMDKLPFSIVITGHMSCLKVFFYYLGILTLIVLSKLSGKHQRNPRQKTKPQPKRINFLKLAGLFGFLIIIFLLLFHHPVQQDLQFTFFDVDQGDGILIESPSGKVFMIDGGSSSVSALYRYRLESALKYKGIRKIDYALISHTDTDHISAVLEMLDESGAGSIEIAHLALPFIPDNTHYEELMAAAKEQEIPVLTLKKGVSLTDGELVFTCLYPESGYHASDVNNYSAVMSLRYGEFDALFTGDIGEEGEKILLQEETLKDYELLKVAHHGSRFSSSMQFLERCAPETAIISAGLHNSYGHPHPDTLTRLKDIGAECFVTAEIGEIEVFASQNGRFRVQPYLS